MAEPSARVDPFAPNSKTLPLPKPYSRVLFARLHIARLLYHDGEAGRKEGRASGNSISSNTKRTARMTNAEKVQFLPRSASPTAAITSLGNRTVLLVASRGVRNLKPAHRSLSPLGIFLASQFAQAGVSHRRDFKRGFTQCPEPIAI